MLSCRQNTDERGRPAQAEPVLGAEIKVELSEWENGEMGLEESRVHIAWRSLADSGVGSLGELHLGGAWTPTVALPFVAL